MTVPLDIFLAPHVVAIVLLVLGAASILLLAPFLSTRPTVAATIGILFVLSIALFAFFGLEGIPGSVIALCAVAILVLLLVPVFELQESEHVAEVTALVLLGTGGGIALANAGDLLQAVIGLETLALSAVIAVALGRGEQPVEAAFKYFVLGAMSLAALLYGVGLVYLGTGSFAFPSAGDLAASNLVLAGTVLITIGLAFELAVFPFHWGALDAYTAASPALAGFVMTASKIAAAYALGLLVTQAGVPAAQVMVWIGSLTILWGTFGAIAQRNFRRMLAYSAITHAGFIALAVGSGPRGPETAVFYATVYASMALLTFASLAGRAGDPIPFDRVRNGDLGSLRAGGLALGLLSLSGIPPTPGFWAKLAVLVVAWQSAGIVPTLIAVVGGVFSVLYYLRPLPDLFAALRTPADRADGTAALPAIGLGTVAVVGLGIFPGLAWALARLTPFGG